MKNAVLLLMLSVCSFTLQAQTPQVLITTGDVSRIVRTLADDSMLGRRTFTPGLEKASRFIESEFSRIGLDTLPGNQGYRQAFTLRFVVPDTIGVRLDGLPVPAGEVIARTLAPRLDWHTGDSCHTAFIGPGEPLFAAMRNYLNAPGNNLVVIDTSFRDAFQGLREELNSSNAASPLTGNVLYVLGFRQPRQFSVHVVTKTAELSTHNLVGVLAARRSPGRWVVFSAHYDHLGTGSAVAGDSIYNGANDDASGTTAVVELARYYKSMNNNALSLMFVAFTGEEEGGYGSHYFATRVNPDSIIAVCNIEMIGTPSRWGKRSVYLTGFNKGDLGTIMQQGLRGTPYRLYPDPYPSERLFYRSDNITLARLGVPAHSISTARMEAEPHYHQRTDEVNTLDINNMTAVIRAIALSMSPVVSGTRIPLRLRPETWKR